MGGDIRQRTQLAVEALAELKTGAPSPAALQVLRDAADLWFRAGASISFDRALRLPTARMLRRMAFAFAASQALRLTAGDTPNARATALHRQLCRMVDQGVWKRWRDAGGPPAEAPELQRRAYEVLSNGRIAGRPQVPSVPTLRRLVDRQTEPLT